MVTSLPGSYQGLSRGFSLKKIVFGVFLNMEQFNSQSRVSHIESPSLQYARKKKGSENGYLMLREYSYTNFYCGNNLLGCK